MDRRKEDGSSGTPEPPPPAHEPPFDATTNFSIFGWMLEKLGWVKRGEKQVDLTLEK